MPSDDEEISDEEIEEMLAEMGSDDEMSSDDEDLEEILRELEDTESEEDMMEAEDPEAAEEDMVDEEINLDELINALREEEDPTEDEEEALAGDRAAQMEAKKNKMKMKKMEGELHEAYSAVKYLRTKLNEVNLLNAKLLYVNKLFRKGTLSEAQKVKIIETFDRAKSVREAKLIFSTLYESINNTAQPKKSFKLNEGFASKPQKGTKVIPQTNELYKRFSELINYNPNN
jgi:hypothetical protein